MEDNPNSKGIAMTQDEIIEMAKQAGFLTNELKSYVISPYTFEDQDLYEELEAFANLVKEKERELLNTVFWAFQEWKEDHLSQNNYIDAVEQIKAAHGIKGEA